MDSPLTFSPDTHQVSCPSLSSLGLRWFMRNSHISARGIYNDALVELSFEEDTHVSSGYFSGNPNIKYNSIVVRITTAPTAHCKSDVLALKFQFNDYGESGISKEDIIQLLRLADQIKFAWSSPVKSSQLFEDILQYINWATTAGYSF